MKRIFLGFSFYGAGNIGDDLMLYGFIKGFVRRHREYQIFGCLDHRRLHSQRKRFPEITWFPREYQARSELLNSCDVWLGLGGTPFQGSSGPWLLDAIEQELSLLPAGTPKLMLGVGCEREVLLYSGQAKRVAQAMNWIGTRDDLSTQILVKDLEVNPNRIFGGADLAHIALAGLFPYDSALNSSSTGIVFYQEKPDSSCILALKSFSLQHSEKCQIVFLANDIRYEKRLYKLLFGNTFLARLLNKPSFYSPPYQNGNIYSLFSHFRFFGTVFASRYHALLASAWAGSRVVAIDRGSKVSELATELKIEFISPPWSLEKFEMTYQRATLVPREHLQAMRSKTEQMLYKFSEQVDSSC